VQRTTDQVVEQIRQSISDGVFRHGAKLPAERELGAQFGVSRGVIREAIKILNGMGLVESRQGSGIYVLNDPVPAISRALTMSLRRESRMVHQLFEIRSALESLAVSLAVRNHTADDLARIRSFVQVDGITAEGEIPLEELATNDLRFHAAVAQSADNPYLVVLIQTVGDLLTSTFPVSEIVRDKMLSAQNTHASILDAIEARDEERAVRLMREHLARSENAASAAAETSQSNIT
jgi:GntR family transcriptional repressor for pyruvate dehydrogenase complex